jgi:hypothetical protein
MKVFENARRRYRKNGCGNCPPLVTIWIPTNPRLASRPMLHKTMPAMAIGRWRESRPLMPKTNPTIDVGRPIRQQQEKNSDTMPRISEAIAAFSPGVGGGGNGAGS